mgnify:CR=1 FL=1
MTKNTTTKPKKLLTRRNDLNGWILMLPMVVILYLFIWRPTVMGTVWSFFNMKAYTVMDFCGFDNFRKVITHTQFLPTLWNTVQYVLWSFVIGFLPPLFIAIMINEVVHFKGGFRVLIYTPAVIPGIAAMLMWYFMYYPDQTGLLNMILGKFGRTFKHKHSLCFLIVRLCDKFVVLIIGNVVVGVILPIIRRNRLLVRKGDMFHPFFRTHRNGVEQIFVKYYVSRNFIRL